MAAWTRSAFSSTPGATAIYGVAAQAAVPPPYDPPHYHQHSGPSNVTDAALAFAAIYAAAHWYFNRR